MLYEDITEKILGAAFAVHNGLGAGFVDSVYEEALCHELGLRNIPFARQVKVDVLYKDTVVGTHRIDLIVDEEVVVELKAMKEVADIHTAVVLSYLAATRLPVALLLNFKRSRLDYRRYVG